MENLIFGPDFPQVSFSLSPNERTGFSVASKNNWVFSNRRMLKTVTWFYLNAWTTPELVDRKQVADADGYVYDFYSGNWDLLKKALLLLPGSAAEKSFLTQYFEICEKKGQYEKPDNFELSRCITMAMPALIPQVWINWLYWDPKDKSRAEEAQKVPNRLDFVMFYQSRKIAIEIDGTSHFSDILDLSEKDVIRFEPSLKKYTEHLKKDRWLRREKWDLWRFSNLEVEDSGTAGMLFEMGVTGPLEMWWFESEENEF